MPPPSQRTCLRAVSVWPKRTRCGHDYGHGHGSASSSSSSYGNANGYATQAPGAPSLLQVFNRDTKRLQRERAATADVELSRRVDYLRDEVARRLCERLLDINRHLPRVLDLGANACNVARALSHPNPDPDPAKPTSPALATRLSHLIAADSARGLLHRDESLPFNEAIPMMTRQVVDDIEYLPYEADSFDAVLSSMSLHWVNDLPSLLAQVNRMLKPDSPLLAAMLGGDTLFELRTSLQLAELERRGGLSPRVSPLADVRDVGGLLQRAGYNLITVDVDDIVVDYPSSYALMQDLQAMGESNAVLGREPGPIPRDVLLAVDPIYRELHGNEDGSIPATFRVIYLIGWKKGPDQPRPLQRGTGEVNLKKILEGGDR